MLSGGEKRRVALCRLLLSRPDMLLLDEPTNHLDAESVYWLEKFLEEFSGTVVAVTHDRYFLDNVAGWILELDRGHGIPYEGNYSTWLEAKNRRLETESKQEISRQKALKQELEWVRQNPKGRQAKNKARIARFDELNSQEFQTRNETNEIYIAPGERLGDKVIILDKVSKGLHPLLPQLGGKLSWLPAIKLAYPLRFNFPLSEFQTNPRIASSGSIDTNCSPFFVPSGILNPKDA